MTMGAAAPCGRWLRWPLGVFLLASALAHAALFVLPLELPSGRDHAGGPLAVTLLPGPAPAAARHRPPPPAPSPRRAVRPAAVRPQAAVLPPKPIAPAPAPPAPTPQVPRPLAVAGPRPAAAPPTSPVPDTLPRPGTAPATAAVAVAAAAPPPSPAASTAAGPATAPQPADFGAADGPRVVHLEDPVYPARALRLRREGKVLLRLEIDSTGRLQSATVVKGAGYGFDASALAAVRRARFAPATRGGVPVSCVALLPISFTLAPLP